VGKSVLRLSYKFSEFRENKDTTNVTNRKRTVTAKLTANLKTVISINDEHSENDEQVEEIFPKIPKSLFEAKAMIFQNKKDFVSNNEPFCFMDSKSSIPIFTNATNMSL